MTALSLGAPPHTKHEPARNLPRHAAEATDWSGLWFRLVEDAYGEYIGMRGGKRQPDGSIAWTFLSHAQYDGLGGFVHLLRQRAGHCRVDVPIRRSRIPPLMARARALLRLIARRPQPAAKWRSFDDSVELQRSEPGAAFATELFDEARTRRLTVTAQSQGVPLNCFLLAALGRASQSELGLGPARWMMPVNMRGPVALARDTANQTGYLQIEIAPNSLPSQVHDQVKLALRRRDHWATWQFLNAGRIVGLRGIRAIYKMQMARFEGRPFVGSFTNLGSWKGHGQWFVCPPVARTCPVGVGAIICDGQLSLTIEAHPTVAQSASWSRALMDRWLVELAA